jgi:hypothetical protein
MEEGFDEEIIDSKGRNKEKNKDGGQDGIKRGGKIEKGEEGKENTTSDERDGKANITEMNTIDCISTNTEHELKRMIEYLELRLDEVEKGRTM